VQVNGVEASKGSVQYTKLSCTPSAYEAAVNCVNPVNWISQRGCLGVLKHM
jgi:hypothetical protein